MQSTYLALISITDYNKFNQTCVIFISCITPLWWLCLSGRPRPICHFCCNINNVHNFMYSNWPLFYIGLPWNVIIILIISLDMFCIIVWITKNSLFGNYLPGTVLLKTSTRTKFSTGSIPQSYRWGAWNRAGNCWLLMAIVDRVIADVAIVDHCASPKT